MGFHTNDFISISLFVVKVTWVWLKKAFPAFCALALTSVVVRALLIYAYSERFGIAPSANRDHQAQFCFSRRNKQTRNLFDFGCFLVLPVDWRCLATFKKVRYARKQEKCFSRASPVEAAELLQSRDLVTN